MKALKILLASVVALVLLAAIAIGVIFATVDPNEYREEIAQKVRAETGREFAINGDIELSIYPWLGVAINDVVLGNAPGFAPKNMAEMKTAGVSVQLWPLLKKELIVDVIRLEGAKVWLAKDATGKTNWDDLTAAKSEDTAKPEKESTGGELASLDVAGLKLVDTRLEWRDAQGGSHYIVDDLNLTTGTLADGAAFPLELSAKLNSDAPSMQMVLQANTDLTFWLQGREQPALQADELRVTINTTGENLPNGKLDLVLGANLAADLATQTASIKALKIELLNLQVGGEFDATKITDAPQVNGTISIAEFSLRKLLAGLSPDWQPPADASAMTAVALTSNISATDTQASLSQLKIKLDDSALTGSAGVGPFSAPQIRFDLNVDQLNADRYLTTADVAEAAASEGEGGGYDREAVNAIELPVEPLRSLNLDGKAAIGSLQVSNLRLSNASVELKAADGLLQIAPLKAGLYEGNVNLTATYDVRDVTPKLMIKETLSGVKAGPLQQDLMSETYVTGTTLLTADLNGQGKTVGKLRQSLNGDMAFKLVDGALQGVNIGQSVRKARALLKGQQLDADAAATQSTDFAALTGTIQIVNGLATNNDLAMASPALRLSGKGTAHLYTEVLDYRAEPAIVESSKGQGGKQGDELNGVKVPVDCQGTFTAPKCKIDIKSALETVAKGRVKEEADANIDKQTDRLKERLDKEAPGVRDLFKNLRGK